MPGGPVETPGFFPPGAPRPPRILQADVMAVPILWLASPQSDGLTGCRFIARDWDQQLPAAEAANKCRTLAACEIRLIWFRSSSAALTALAR